MKRKIFAIIRVIVGAAGTYTSFVVTAGTHTRATYLAGLLAAAACLYLFFDGLHVLAQGAESDLKKTLQKRTK